MRPVYDMSGFRDARRVARRSEEESAAADVEPAAAPADAEKLSLGELVVGDVYKGIVKGVVNFGAFVDIGAEKDGLLHVSDFGERGFVADASKFFSVGQEVEVRLKSVESGSGRIALEANKEKEVRIALEDLVVGSQVEGKIRGVASFGAFVDIGAESDGLLHISQLKGFVEDINTELKAGDTISVRVASVDTASKKVGLSMREAGEAGARKPREKQDISKYTSMGFEEKIEGTVVGIERYGAFVQLEDGIRGLLPISHMTEGRLESVESMMKKGDTIKVAVLQANPEDGKISFTLIDPASAPKREKRDGGDEKRGGGGSEANYFEDVTSALKPNEVVSTAVKTYDEAPYRTALGGALEMAGLKMSDNARNILKQHHDTLYEGVFAAQKAAVEEEAAAKAAAETEAVAAAAAAEAEEKADEEPVAA